MCVCVCVHTQRAGRCISVQLAGDPIPCGLSPSHSALLMASLYHHIPSSCLHHIGTPLNLIRTWRPPSPRTVQSISVNVTPPPSNTHSCLMKQQHSTWIRAFLRGCLSRSALPDMFFCSGFKGADLCRCRTLSHTGAQCRLSRPFIWAFWIFIQEVSKLQPFFTFYRFLCFDRWILSFIPFCFIFF